MTQQKINVDKQSEEKHKKEAQLNQDSKLVLEIEKLKKEIEEQKKLVEENKHKYLRALADYQNFENRVREDKELLVRTANAYLILKLLPFLDSLDKAEVFFKDSGLKMIKEQYIKVLSESGLEEIQLLGKEFDPYVAEVIDIVEGDKDNIVVEILRKGYKFHEKIIQVAQVKVSKKK